MLTQPLSALYRRDIGPQGRHLVMLAGGELLAPSWAQMAEHLVPHTASLQMKRFHSRTGHARWGWFWRRVYGCPNLQPWTVSPADFPDPDRVHVVYNAVGGTTLRALSPDQLAWQAEALRQADWLTVRDEPTAQAVAARGLPKPVVVPDSAVVMAGLLPPEEAARWRMEILSRSGLDDGPYLCIQAAERWSRGQEALIAAELRRIHATTGLRVLSFAIGRAAGHDDQVTSARLKQQLSDAPWFATAPTDLPVNGIMALIAGSAGYAGTSLHGFITAFAFGRPRVGMMPHLAKVAGFRDAWDLPTMPAGIGFDALSSSVGQALAHDPDALARKAAEVAGIYRASFDEMAHRIGA